MLATVRGRRSHGATLINRAFATTTAAEAPATTEGEVLTGEHVYELGLTLGLVTVCTSSYMPASHNNIIFNL